MPECVIIKNHILRLICLISVFLFIFYKEGDSYDKGHSLRYGHSTPDSIDAKHHSSINTAASCITSVLRNDMHKYFHLKVCEGVVLGR